MGAKRREDSFWLSYSDLMTSLFFIMLVLFIVCIIKMKGTQNELSDLLGQTQATAEQYANILKLEEQFKDLSTSSTLRYDEEHRTFIAKDFEGKEIFEPEKSVIKPEFIDIVDKVGADLDALLSELHKNNPSFSYLLVIEGNAANSVKNPMPVDSKYAYELSYQRSLALYNRWTKDKHIDLRKYNTEIQICGSGFNGINRDKKVEDNNKRFVIQIIPKISRPKLESSNEQAK